MSDITKIKLKDKFVAAIDYADDYIIVKKGDVFMFGELCRNEGQRDSLLAIYDGEYELEFKPEELEQIYKYAIPLAIAREQRIDEIFEDEV